MGQALGCGEREREKTSFSDEDYSALEKSFNKYSRIQGGSSGVHISQQGFQNIFFTNKTFAKKLFKWASKRSSKNVLGWKQYFDIAEIFLGNNPHTWAHRNLDFADYTKAELFGMVSLENQIWGREFDREFVFRVEVTYSEGLSIVNQLTKMFLDDTDMQNPHQTNDDIAAKVLANGIFSGKDKLEFSEFFNILQTQLPLVDTYIQNYISTLFLNKPLLPSKIPEYYYDPEEGEPLSLIMRKSISAVMCMTHENYGQYRFMKPLFEFLSYDSEFDYQEFSQKLLEFNEGPTLILIRHIEEFEEIDEYALAKGINPDRIGKNHYVLGILNREKYRQYPQLSGDSQTTLFSIIPNYKVFTTSRGQMGKQYANLVLNNQGQNRAGLSFGGDPRRQSRIFIGENIADSYIQNDGASDQTYEKGALFDAKIEKLNIDIIEVWGLSNTVNDNNQVLKITPTIDRRIEVDLNEDIGVMKPQDSGFINELEDVHNRVTQVPVVQHTQHHHEEYNTNTSHQVLQQQSVIRKTYNVQQTSSIQQVNRATVV